MITHLLIPLVLHANVLYLSLLQGVESPTLHTLVRQAPPFVHK